MAIIKCKMCGGDIELAAEKTFGTCEFCGSTMTLPKIDDEQRAAAFNRGNHFRRIGEFDKALAVYERIVREDDTDAEAHWCCALCRFGIEYVEDPTTYEWLPTCHRASFDSFLEDVDYKAAVEYSGGITRRQYMKDGAKIAEVQRGILATSQNAEPYDVFICYKETDEAGERTRDSLMAQDIYYQLTEQGRKVFFARITLEDVAGAQYEPYIFAALNSAKVMIVVGTKAEHLNAVWVKNEWSRFLAMMKKDRHKLLLPCYRDIDPYDMPEQLSVLQSYDMGKIGFIQDLTRGIAKVLDAEKKPEPVRETVVVQPNAPATNIAPLLKRAFMFLEDAEWNRADEFCEQVLNIDPECAQAYLGKLMAELQVRKQADLRDCEKPFDNKNNYQKVMRFGDSQLKDFLTDCTKYIIDRNETARLETIYNDAIRKMIVPSSSKEYYAVAEVFKSISGYQDADELAERCIKMAESAHLEEHYNKAIKAMNTAGTELGYDIAEGLFQQIITYKDSDERAEKCRELAETARKNEILVAAKTRMRVHTITSYREAINQLNQISGWKNADELIAECQQKIEEIETAKERAIYDAAKKLMASNLVMNYKEAIKKLETIKQFKDSEALIQECHERAEIARKDSILASGKGKMSFETVLTCTEALNLFRSVPGWKNADELAAACEEKLVQLEAEQAERERLVAIAHKNAERKAKRKKVITVIVIAVVCAVIAYVIALNNYIIPANKYNDAIALMDAGNIVEAYEALVALDGYRDSADKANSIYFEYKVEKLKVAKVGDYALFGAYEQDNNTSNGKEDIEWLVLEIKDGKVLVVSKYALDCKPYNTSYTDVTWETCTLRKWLNNYFVNSAFSADEKAMIPTVTVSADKNPDYSTNPGNTTQDQVFLLSITEVNKYFSSNSARQCKSTDYAVTNGVWKSNSGNCWWWLRSPGDDQDSAAGVNYSGFFNERGNGVSNDSSSVRPAMWIDLSVE